MTTTSNGGGHQHHGVGGVTSTQPDALRSRRSMTVTSPPSNSFLLGGQVHSAVGAKSSQKRLRNPKRIQQRKQQRQFVILVVCGFVGILCLAGFLLWWMALSSSSAEGGGGGASTSYGKRVVEQLRKGRRNGRSNGNELFHFIDPNLVAAGRLITEEQRLRQIIQVNGGHHSNHGAAGEQQRIETLTRTLLEQEHRKVHFHLPQFSTKKEEEEKNPQPPPASAAIEKQRDTATTHAAAEGEQPRHLVEEEEAATTNRQSSGRNNKNIGDNEEKKTTTEKKQKSEPTNDHGGSSSSSTQKSENKKADPAVVAVRREHEDGELFPVRPLTDLSPDHHNIPAPAQNNLAQPAPASTPSSPLPPPLPLTLSNMDDNHHPALLTFSSMCSSSSANTNNNNNNNNNKQQQHQSSDAPIIKIQTTLVVQMSLDRAWLLQETCRRWLDPIVAVLVLSHLEAHQEYALHLHEWTVTCPQMRLVTHILHNNNNDTTNEKSSPSESSVSYPVNHLRNLGLQVVQTTHVLVTDVDFIPSQSLQDDIRNALEMQHMIMEQQQQQQQHASHYQTSRRALIVPAFERTCSDSDNPEQEDCAALHFRLKKDRTFLPRSFEELRTCALNKECTVFQHKDNWEGHSSTQSSQWLARQFYQNTNTTETAAATLANGTVLYDVKQLPCFESLRYEPYVVIPWCPLQPPPPPHHELSSRSTNHLLRPDAPFYDERFHGYGKNKIEYISHLRFLQYRFGILPRGFLIHNPHGNSPSKDVWLHNTSSSSMHREMDDLYPQFLQELAQKYFHQDFSWLSDYPNVVGLCEETKRALNRQLQQHQQQKKKKKKQQAKEQQQQLKQHSKSSSGDVTATTGKEKQHENSDQENAPPQNNRKASSDQDGDDDDEDEEKEAQEKR